jgi:hypothetical protein
MWPALVRLNRQFAGLGQRSVVAGCSRRRENGFHADASQLRPPHIGHGGKLPRTITPYEHSEQ